MILNSCLQSFAADNVVKFTMNFDSTSTLENHVCVHNEGFCSQARCDEKLHNIAGLNLQSRNFTKHTKFAAHHREPNNCVYFYNRYMSSRVKRFPTAIEPLCNDSTLIREDSICGMRTQKILTLSNMALNQIDEDCIEENANIEEIDLSVNNISQIEASTFATAIQLTSLDLSFNPLREIHPKLFIALTKLRVLNLQQCEIKSIHPSTFKSQTKLEKLILLTNAIGALQPETFLPLTNLRLLSLASNHIKSLNSNSFGVHNSLEEFLVSFNRIAAIERRFLANFPNLKYIAAKGNICVDKDFFALSEFEVFTILELEKCFDDWKSSGVGLKAEIVRLVFLILFNKLLR